MRFICGVLGDTAKRRKNPFSGIVPSESKSESGGIFCFCCYFYQDCLVTCII